MAFVSKDNEENMCIKINTQFIQLLVIKKNLNLYIGREMQTVVIYYDEGMTDVLSVQNPHRNSGNSLNYSSVTTITTVIETHSQQGRD